MNKRNYSPIFVFLNVFFVSALLISNILATKQVELTPWLHTTGGFVIFPITYILSDLFSEVYGYKASRRVSWIGFTMNFFMVIAFQLALLLPFPSWWRHQTELQTILGSTPRIVLASLAAFQFGNWINDIMFQKLRNRQGEKGFWFRAVTSSIAGEALDSSIFFLIAFIGLMPLKTLPTMVLTGVITKVLYEIILLPCTLVLVKKIRQYEGNDVYKPAETLGIFG